MAPLGDDLGEHGCDDAPSTVGEQGAMATAPATVARSLGKEKSVVLSTRRWTFVIVS